VEGHTGAQLSCMSNWSSVSMCGDWGTKRVNTVATISSLWQMYRPCVISRLHACHLLCRGLLHFTHRLVPTVATSTAAMHAFRPAADCSLFDRLSDWQRAEEVTTDGSCNLQLAVVKSHRDNRPCQGIMITWWTLNSLLEQKGWIRTQKFVIRFACSTCQTNETC